MSASNVPKVEKLSPYSTFSTQSRRAVVFSTKGIVATSQTLASEIGLSILKKGGNCADAGVAAAAALAVTEPSNCGIGGDVFALFYDAKTQTVRGINGSGRSPSALTLAKARELGLQDSNIPRTNINCVTVPGSAAAWCDIHSEWGSGRLQLSEILEPACALAEEGFPVSSMAAEEWRKEVDHLKNASEDGKKFLLDGQAPQAGQIWSNPDLAKTMRDLGQKGKDGFYKGRAAEEIVKLIQSKGGVMTMEDLASHQSEFVEPISYTYGTEQHTLHECPPNGQGIVALLALGIIDTLKEDGVVNIEDLEEGSAEWYHLLIEAVRLAFADVRTHVGDPQKSHIPIKEMLSKTYLRERAQLFNKDKAEAQYLPGEPFKHSDTVYFCASDEEGNAISLIMSVFSGFGSGAVPKDCGFNLQNRGSGFVLNEGPNGLEGGKRPYHTIIPAMVTKGKELYMSFGVMGGNAQPQSQVQVLLNHIHHGHHPQSALDRPRFLIGGNVSYATNLQKQFYNGVIALEEGIPKEVSSELESMGHEIQMVSGYERINFGKGQMILKTKDGRTGKTVWAAGTDPRSDGVSLPLL